MAERRPIYRDAGKNRRPPRSHGGATFSVPLWEKKFCTDACAIPWGKLCETKRLMSLYKNVVDWDDSAALEAFNDAKARFCAVYHGQHYDNPLPDPNMYIDVVNPDGHVDPELVSDLEKSRRRVPRKDNGVPDVWDSFIFSDKPVPVTGWGDTETSNTHGQHLSVNWDNQLEQPVEANCKQTSSNWDCYVQQPAQTIGLQSSGNWEVYDEQQGQTSSWMEQTKPCITNWTMRDGSQDAWKHDYGWGPAATQTDPCDNHEDSYDAPDNQGVVPYGHWTHWRRQNNDSGKRSNRNRDRGGPISAKPMKSKYQADDHSGANNAWRNCRVRNDMHYYSYGQPGYAKQSLAM